MGRYDDIINLPHHTSPSRPRMALIDRAAQFSPFAALTGYDDAIKETARVTDKRRDLDENEKAILDERLRLLMENTDNPITVEVCYFVSDNRKEGGTYHTVNGTVKKIKTYERQLIMDTGTILPIDDIESLDSPLFSKTDTAW